MADARDAEFFARADELIGRGDVDGYLALLRETDEPARPAVPPMLPSMPFVIPALPPFPTAGFSRLVDEAIAAIPRRPLLDPSAVDGLLRRMAIGLDVPPQVLGLDRHLPVPPRSRRERVAAHVGQAGWRVGWTVAQTGRLLARAGVALDRAGDRLIDAGDWLAGKVAGRA